MVKEAGSSDSIEQRGDPSLAEYASRYFTCGQVYLDPDWAFYHALGSRTIGISGIWQFFNPFTAIDRVRGLREKQIDGNLVGEGLTLGGVIVMAPGGTGVVYTYLEETGQMLPISDIQKAVNQVVTRRGADGVEAEDCQASSRQEAE